MSGRGDELIEVAIERRLARGPADVLDLLATIRKRRADVVKRQEGALHALLHAGLRRGRIIVVGRSARGLVLYAPAGTKAQDDGAEPPVPEPLPASISRTALKVVKPVRDAADRGRVLADVVAHLTELASRKAGKDFGPVRTTRSLLQRADRGRFAVFFTASGGDRLRRLVVHEGPWILTAVALFFLLRAFVGEVFQIPSESMRPTLEPGDRVVVSKLSGGALPERWSIVVFRHYSQSRGREIAVVKRVIGLPGEEFAVYQGDLFVDGELLVKPDPVRTALRLPHSTWEPSGGTLLEWDRSESGGSIHWTLGQHPLSGDVFYREELRRAATRPVPLFDGYLRLSADVPEGGGASVTVVRAALGDADASKNVGWTLSAGGAQTTVVERRFGVAPETLVSVPVGPTAGAVSLELAYVDGILRASWDTAEGHWSFSAARTAPYLPLALRVGTRGEARVRAIDLDQDVHYSHDHQHAVPSQQDLAQGRTNPHRIPEGHVFFLGDNTRDSMDSRAAETGDIPLGALVGPVTFRIWPPSRIGPVR